MNKLDLVTSHYEPGSATEIENNLMLNWYPKRIIKRVSNNQEKSILELGIGHGFTTNYFSKNFESHLVVEGSGKVIEMFHANPDNNNVRVVESYFEDFHTEEKFDVIVMGFILEHVDDPELILKKFREFLKPGGGIYIAVPNAKSLNRRLGLELGLIDDIYELNENDIALGHQRQYCLESLKEVIEKCGFITTHEEGIYLKPLPINFMKGLPDFQDNLNAMLAVGVKFPELCVGLLLEVKIK